MNHPSLHRSCRGTFGTFGRPRLDNFTPWLAENIGTLGAALGMDLAVQSTEVPIGQFALDILARSPERIGLWQSKIS